jgi:alanine racemase
MRQSSYLEVNLSLLEKNVSLIKEMVGHSRLIPMIKANAYGHGLKEIGTFLIKECLFSRVGVASLGEALFLKEILKDEKFSVWVFSDHEIHIPSNHALYQDQDIVPVIHHKDDLQLLLSAPSLKNIPLVLKLNTGMNRLGLAKEEVIEFLPELKLRGIYHLMTHFSRSSEIIVPGDKTNRQYDEFLRFKNELKNNQIEVEETSVSNSGAIEQNFGFAETFVRPGLMIYGPSGKGAGHSWNWQQISRLVTRVISVNFFKKGTPVGYGSNVLDKDSWIVVLALGYGDGILTFYSGAKISLNGMTGKIFGRVNMDMTFVQFDSTSIQTFKKNDLVEIWGHHDQNIADFSAQVKSHSYQVLCALSSRLPRIYKVQ